MTEDTIDGFGQPFSIYFKLEDGKRADFEVVAKSSLALISALRDLVDFADPMLDLKVTIQNGEEGSLRLNTFIKTLFSRGDEARTKRQKMLNWILAGAAYFILETTAGHYLDLLLDRIDELVIEAIADGEDPDEAQQLAEDCRKIVEGAMRNDVAARHVRRFYEELHADPNVTGVGVSLSHTAPPATIVERSEFLYRSSLPEKAEEDSRRERVERLSVLLVQPRLLGDEKAWRFSVGGIEFAAKVADRQFIDDTLSGKNSIPLIEGVYLDVDMRYDERKLGGVWVIKSRVVQQVHSVSSGKSQGSLLGSV